MKQTTDIAVIGAGVAGAMAALRLARLGHRVTLIEKSSLPRDKVCGCCLNSEAVAELTDAGLGGLLDTATALHRVDLLAGGRSATVKLPRGVAISRRALDAALVEQAIASGCVVHDRTVGRVVRAAPDAVEIETTSQGITRTLHAKLAIVADGLAGSALTGHACFTRQTAANSKRGYGTHVPVYLHDHPAGRITMRCGSRGYLGAVVLEDGSLDLAAAIDPDFVKQCRGIAPAVAAIIDQAGNPLPIRTDLYTLAWKATPALTGARPQRWSASMPGVLLLGDSAGYVEPFTGEGMAWALRGASAIVPIAERVIEHGWSNDAGAAWDRVYRRQVAKRQARCRVVAGLLRRPRLTAAVVALLSKLPEVSRGPIDAVLAPGGLGSAAGPNERRALWR